MQYNVLKLSQIFHQSLNDGIVPILVDQLKNELSGLELVEPKGGKDARANAIEPLWSAGNVYIPHPAICDWSEEFLNWCVKFPNGKFDDDIDAMSQALTHLSNSALAKLKAAMQNIQ